MSMNLTMQNIRTITSIMLDRRRIDYYIKIFGYSRTDAVNMVKRECEEQGL